MHKAQIIIALVLLVTTALLMGATSHEPKTTGDRTAQAASQATWEYARLKVYTRPTELGEDYHWYTSSAIHHVEDLQALCRLLGADASTLPALLDHLGGLGWELVSYDREGSAPRDDQVYYYEIEVYAFKRRR